MKTNTWRAGAIVLAMTGAGSAMAQTAYNQCIDEARLYKAKDLARCTGQSGQSLRDCETRADELYKKRMGDCDVNETRRMQTAKQRVEEQLAYEKQRRIDAARRAGKPLPN